MRKHFFSLLTLLLVVPFCWAAVTAPADLPDYYSGYLDNKSGSVLFTGIHDVAGVGFHSLSYGGVWTAYAKTDTKSDGTTIYDYYSYCSSYTYHDSQDGQPGVPGSKEGDCYNREHSIPKSWFGGSTSEGTPGTDIFHLVPADKIVNSLRNNHPYGEVSASSATSKTRQECGTRPDPEDNYNRYGQGSSITITNTILSSGTSTQSPSVTVFEPLAEYKGDLARGYFGTMIKWAGDYAAFTSADGSQMFSGDYTYSGKFGLTPYGVALLMKWHREDPVSQREIDRNNGIQDTQGNRNPFIDYPILAEYLWGKYSGQTFAMENAVGSFESTFVPGVSDGDASGGGEPPLPPTKHAITWSIDGSSNTVQVTENTRPAAPLVANCSASRVFMGWTTSPVVTSRPAVLYASGEIPNATEAATYYAVYADKTVRAGEGTSNTFSLYSDELTEGDYILYFGGKAMKALVVTPRLGYESVEPDGDAITTEDGSIIWHLAQTDGYWTIYNAAGAKYAASTGTKNQATLADEVSDDKALWTFNEDRDFVNKNNAAAGINATLRNNGSYGFACYSASTGGTLSLYRRSGAAPLITYDNYGLSCIGLVTITFHSNDGRDITTTQQVYQATESALDPYSLARTHYTFEGWATTPEGEKVYDDGGLIITNTNIDLYALWKEEPKYTVTFLNGDEIYYQYTNYAGTIIPSDDLYKAESCDPYTFYGWSTNTYPADFTGIPSVVIASHVPEADETYHAVFEKTVVIPGSPAATVGTTLWEEDFGTYAPGDTPYECVNGATATKIFTGTYAGGVSPELLISKTNGAFTVQDLPTGKAREMTLSFKVNKGNVNFCYITSSTAGIEITNQTITSSVMNCTIANPSGVESFSLTITNQGEQNTRVDDLLLVVKTAAEVEDDETTYRTTEPDCTPVVIPEYTLTFLNGESLYDEVTGHEGDLIAIYDPTSACPEHVFIGWSEEIYASDNTEKPAVVVPGVIPAENKTYHAVYMKKEEVGEGWTNDYRKLTSVSGLTDGKYLLVGNGGGLQAMSTQWKNTYYLKPVEMTADGDIITTANSTVVWQITVDGEQITFYNEEAGYLRIEMTVNGEKTYYNIKLDNNTEANRFTYALSDGAWVFSSVSYPDRQLEYYQGSAYWSYYTHQDAPVYLYKQVYGPIYRTTYTTSQECSSEVITGCENLVVPVAAIKELVNGQLFILRGEQLYDATGRRVR